MDIQQAKKILRVYIEPDGGLYNGGYPRLSWNVGEKIYLDADYTIEELEAIVVYTKHMNWLAANNPRGEKS